jgi:alkylation response protein AidB-like acyl-CoA dehydrogenase
VPTSFNPLFPGMLLDAAGRFAQDHAAAHDFAGTDPIAEMGWACTLVPEELDGAGGTLSDLASIVEGLATHGLHLAVVERCAVVPLLLRAAASEAATHWLAALCEGEAAIAPLTALADPLDQPSVSARHLDIGYELTGMVRGTQLPAELSHVLVPALLDGSEAALFLVDRERLPEPAARYRSMEGRASVDVRLQRLPLPESACLARGAVARAALVRADNAALALTLADTVAALAALIQHTVEHLKERHQFGVALASFQVLRHRTADMYVRFLGARGLLVHALNEYHSSGGEGDALRRSLRLAKVSLAETARTCAEAAIQMHGGMGMSEEVLATRLAQRLLASEFRYGDRLMHTTQLHAEAAAFSQPIHLTKSAP